MAMTVADALCLPAFLEAGAQVAAGGDHLDRPVRWVHVAEVADIARLLKGGELLLTTGIGIDGAEEAQRRYVRELAQGGAAGLVLELGRRFLEPPGAMLAEAQERGLPLVVLHRETRYVEITEQVHRAIISHQYELLRRAEEIGRAFNDLALGGADLAAILGHLAGIVRNPVVLDDVAHQVVEFAVHATPAEEVLRSWERHSRAGHPEPEPGAVGRAESSGIACSWIRIWLRHRLWGRLHVVELDSPLDEIGRLAIDRAAAAIGIALLAEQDQSHLIDRARSALLAALFQGRYASAPDIVRRARSLGVELDRGTLVAVVVELPNLPRLAATRDLSEYECQAMRLAVLGEARTAMTSGGRPALLGLEGERILALLAIREPADPAAAAERLTEEAIRRAEAATGLEVVAGISPGTAPESIAVAFEQAAEAARLGWGPGRRSIHHFGDLGLDQLLIPLARRPELARFVEGELGRVLAHDATSPAPLLPTLRACLKHTRAKAEAARNLHVERRTLYRRLDRIQELLRRDLDDAETRTRLIVALHGLDLLRREGPAVAPGEGEGRRPRSWQVTAAKDGPDTDA